MHSFTCEQRQRLLEVDGGDRSYRKEDKDGRGKERERRVVSLFFGLSDCVDDDDDDEGEVARLPGARPSFFLPWLPRRMDGRKGRDGHGTVRAS